MKIILSPLFLSTNKIEKGVDIFFLKFMPELVLNNHVYVARSPLFKVSHGKNSQYLQDEESLEEYLFHRFYQQHKITTDGRELSKEEIKKLVDDCNDFRNFVQQKSLTVDVKILSLALVYDIFGNGEKFLTHIRNVIDGEIHLEQNGPEIVIKINSLYGKNEHIIKN